MKPPLTYYGGKQQLSKLIVSLIPKHNLYCEPFFGGGAIYFTKEPSEIEVVNDTNGDLINFYQQIKNDHKSLEKEIKATLYSREHHQTARIILVHPHLFNDTKRAWAIWTIANQSYASKLDSPWGYDRKQNTSTKRLHVKRNSFTDVYAKRLDRTEIECRDALEVIKSRDNKESFFYCDPPYFNSYMGHYKNYTKEDFERLLQLLTEIKGKFLLSAYPSDLLTKYIKKHKWHSMKMDRALSIGSSPVVKKKRKTEMLIANYPIG